MTDQIPTNQVTDEASLAAIQPVKLVYPTAKWTIDGMLGRIIAGDRLVSLPFPLSDPLAEQRAWVDASARLGDGKQWKSSKPPAPPQSRWTK